MVVYKMIILTKHQQLILIELARFKGNARVNLFVPKLFHYHSSFYRALIGMGMFIKKEKDIEGHNIFTLTLDGLVIANLLKNLEVN